ETVAKTTAQNYRSSMIKIYKDLGIDEGLSFFINEPETVLIYLNEFKIRNQNSKLSAVLKYIQYIEYENENRRNNAIKLYRDRFNELRTDIRKINDIEPPMVTSETSNWNDIQKQYNKYKRTINFKTSLYSELLEYAIVSCFLLNPPRRTGDYASMLLYKPDTKENRDKLNYFDIDKKAFIFNNYKTSKTYGKQIVECTSKLWNIIEKFIMLRNLMTDKHVYLFKAVKSDRALNDKEISDILTRWGRKHDIKTNIRQLRHSFATELHKKTPPKHVLKKYAYQMGTSQDMIASIYRDDKNRLNN
ncbi:unnamed protein product, partial [Heterosigma akashiwo]